LPCICAEACPVVLTGLSGFTFTHDELVEFHNGTVVGFMVDFDFDIDDLELFFG
jgi:hypothetical protein